MAGMFDDLIPADVSASGRPRITVTPSRPPQFADAISKIESGGRYDATGPVTRTGDRAYGKYQVMGANVPEWTREVFGKEMTPDEFAASPEAQDKVFEAKFGGYVKKYGPVGAAKAWFAGEGGMNDPNRKDVLGTSVQGYADKFSEAIGGNGPRLGTAPQAAPQAAGASGMRGMFDDLIPSAPAAQIDQRFAEPAAPDNADELRRGLVERGAEMTRGPATSPVQRMLTDITNVPGAASQGTTPNVGAQQPNLISTEVFQSDAGEVLFRDPATGQVVPTDSSKHVVIRDPADNRPKVFARTAQTNEGPAVGISRTLATGLAAGAPTARPAVPLMKAAAPSLQDLKSAANKGFDAFRASGVEVPGTAVAGLSRDIGAALTNDGFISEIAPKTFAVLGKIGEAPKGSVVTAQQLHGIRRVLGNVAKSVDPTEKAAASIAMSKLDEFLGTVPEAKGLLDDAMGNYAAAKRSEAIAKAGGKADLQASSAGSGSNIDNAVRQQIKSLLNNPKQLRGFSGEEVGQMRQIVKGTFSGNAARLLGKLAPTGIVSTTMAGGGGFAAGGPVGAVAVPAIGYAFKRLSDAMTASKLNKLDELVRSRSPLGKAASNSLRDWGVAAEAYSNAPRTAKLGTLVVASRNLVNNLKDSGIDVTIPEILKALRSQIPARADQDQE